MNSQQLSISQQTGSSADTESVSGTLVSRRAALTSTLAAAGVAAFGTSPGRAAPAAQPDARRASPKRYEMKKSINLLAFPYPDKMNLEECLKLAKRAGFDGIELNYDLDNDLSPKAGIKEFQAIRKMADQIGIAISGLCSFLFWPYPLTSNDPEKRTRGLELAGKMAQAAHDLGVKNLLVVPGAVHIPWRTDHEPVPNDVCDQRAREAVGKLVPQAEKLGVSLNIENIFFNGYLMTPMEMNALSIAYSERVRVHFDTGNVALFNMPSIGFHSASGFRISISRNFSKKGTDHSLEAFRPLLDGTTNWPAVMEALDQIGYRGYVTFEYFHPYAHYPEALVYQTSDSLDRMLGRAG